MCGIAGFVSLPQVSHGRLILERMTSAIRHRGPDDLGYFTHEECGVHLGHRRLSIVDLSGGHQPIANEDQTSWIVYNGEVFNHAEVRPELERAGHHYTTRSDTETLLHAWEQWGPSSLERFRGMFAFAIWNKASRTLVAARDRLGIKPFYYFWDGRLFAFASEIKALLEHPAITAEPNDAVLPEYLSFGYCSSEQTMFRGIRKLMPGHYLVLRSNDGQLALDIRQYWDVPGTPAGAARSDEEWIRETRQRLEETVRLRLMADVPLGTFLSGGLDSSAVTALVARMVAPQKVKTFSVGYQEARFSELGFARQASQAIGTDHHEVVVGRDDFFSALPRLIWHEDEPITWPSSVSLFFVSQLAARHVTVVLTGEGSDELFGGYERYRWNLWNTRAAGAWGVLPGFLRDAVRRQVRTSPLLRASLRRKIAHTFVGRENSVESLFLDNFYGAFALEEQLRLLDSSPDRIYASYLRYWRDRSSAPLLPRMLYADQKTYLLELLMKQDQMSMATSIESRVPFLDHHFLAFAMSMPDRMKIRGAEQKYALKKAVEDILPHDIIYRTKMGFPTPLRQWFREPASDGLLGSLLAADAFIAPRIDQTVVRGLLERHRGGQEDATDRLWRLLTLELWGQIFFGRGKQELLERSAHLVERP